MRATIRRLADHAAHAAKPAEKAPTGGWGWNNRANRVPYYQRLFQSHSGYRQWEQTQRSRTFIMPIYNTMMWGGLAGTMYMMVRMVLGHKTWY